MGPQGMIDGSPVAVGVSLDRSPCGFDQVMSGDRFQLEGHWSSPVVMVVLPNV